MLKILVIIREKYIYFFHSNSGKVLGSNKNFGKTLGKVKYKTDVNPVIINTTTYLLCLCSVICKMMASLYTIKIALLRNRLLSLINHHSTDSHFGSVKRYFVWHGRKVGPCPWTPRTSGKPGTLSNLRSHGPPGPLDPRTPWQLRTSGTLGNYLYRLKF